MNSIFGIGPLELFFIAILALVILGPERLPGVIREGMKYYRTLRNMSGDLTSQFSEELKALDEINPQRIMTEMAKDLDMEEERKVLADLNPKKIRKDISNSVNPLKATAKKPVTEKAVEATTATTVAAATNVAATDADEPTASESARPVAAEVSAVDSPTEDEVVGSINAANVNAAPDSTVEVEATPVVLTTAEIVARSQPKMSNPYVKSSKKPVRADPLSTEPSASSSSPDLKTSELDESSDTDEPVVENRIAPAELAANIDTPIPSEQTDSATISANGTHDATRDNVEDGA